MCNPFVCASYPVSISVAQVPRPPVIFAQNRSVPENAAGGALIPPALVASQPQGLALNYSVAPTTVFGIQVTTGVLFVQVRGWDRQGEETRARALLLVWAKVLVCPSMHRLDSCPTHLLPPLLQPGATLDYVAQNLYTLTVTALSSAGTQASAPVSVLVTQVNKPPRFTSQLFNATVNEGLTRGGAITAISATSLNTLDSLTYTIIAANPAGALGWFAIDPLVGTLTVSQTIPSGVLLVDRALTYPAPWAVNVSVTVTNLGGLSSTAAVLVNIANIAPRVTAQVNATVRNNATGLTPVLASLTGAVWTPYSASTLSYSLSTAFTADLGLSAFVVTNAVTGAVAVANVSYVDPHSGVTVPGPDFNINAQPVLTSYWVVTDSATGRTNAAPGGVLAVTVLHSNRAPYFSLPQGVTTVISAPQTTAIAFGQALGVVVSDPDLSLNIGEQWEGRGVEEERQSLNIREQWEGGRERERERGRRGGEASEHP